MAAAPAALTEALETALNAMLTLNPEAAEALPGLSGRVLCLDLEGLDLQLWLLPAGRRVQVLGRYEGEPAATIQATPLGLMRMSFGGSEALQEGAARIHGDTAFAQRLGGLLRLSAIDWEELLARGLGDVAGHQLARLLRGFGGWVEESISAMEQDLGEYLAEEAQLVVAPAELEHWMSEVDTLRADVDRFEARLRRLEARRT
ncbi:MAG: Sterol-binding domain protein [Gammaproteobacteria bacterium]|nr:MAG: Sterol-binding domain protein [Gammaproteobacteria bacterium]